MGPNTETSIVRTPHEISMILTVDSPPNWPLHRLPEFQLGLKSQGPAITGHIQSIMGHFVV